MPYPVRSILLNQHGSNDTITTTSGNSCDSFLHNTTHCSMVAGRENAPDTESLLEFDSMIQLTAH